jgi:hypothetical protein
MSTTKEQYRNENYLCTLENGREVYKGDTVYHSSAGLDKVAAAIYIDLDGDRYLCFEDYGDAWIDGPSNFGQNLR